MKSMTLGLFGLFALGQAVPASAQSLPAPAAPPTIQSPTYTSLAMEVTVARSATEVWARIGRFCDIAEFSPLKCEISTGKEDELGAVRVLDGTYVEVLVSKTPLSYVYALPVRAGTPYNLYHGTLEARPIDANSSKLVYSLLWDNSMLADDAARTKDRETRQARFTGALDTMKRIVESGKPRQ